MRHDSVTLGTEVIALSPDTVGKAQGRVSACQSCSPSVTRPFGAVLVEVLGAAEAKRHYLLSFPAECPNCSAPMLEHTLVRTEGERTEVVSGMGFILEERREDVEVVLIDESLLVEAEAFISGCEHCAGGGSVFLDYVLDAVTGADPTTTEYVMCRPLRCPCCSQPVTEKTGVHVSANRALV